MLHDKHLEALFCCPRRGRNHFRGSACSRTRIFSRTSSSMWDWGEDHRNVHRFIQVYFPCLLSISPLLKIEIKPNKQDSVTSSWSSLHMNAVVTDMVLLLTVVLELVWSVWWCFSVVWITFAKHHCSLAIHRGLLLRVFTSLWCQFLKSTFCYLFLSSRERKIKLWSTDVLLHTIIYIVVIPSLFWLTSVTSYRFSL